MKIRILGPGKIRDKWLLQGIDEYKKRISPYAVVEIEELPSSPDSIPVNKGLEAEGDKILSRIKPGEMVWVMDLHGKLLTSEEFSSALITDLEKGGANLTIVIGGSNGIDERVRQRASRKICLGNITMTHFLTRLVLMEQIYRGFKINEGGKYHK